MSVAVAERHDDVWASVGVHPHEADAHPDLGAAVLVEGTRHPRVVAIGECGLDYYYDKSDRQAQRERFEAHIDAAQQTGLPLIVHTRDAEDDTAEILERAVKEQGVTGVLHCFTGSAELARKGARPRLFRLPVRDRHVQERAGPPADGQLAARSIGCLWRRIRPFLAPVPHRGRKCEPAFVADTASFVARAEGRGPGGARRGDHREFLQAFQQGSG